MNDTKQVEGWDVLKDRIILKTPIVTIKAGPVLCKRTGIQKDFYLIDFPDWVNIVALTTDRNIVMIRQFRYGSNRMEIEVPGVWSMTGSLLLMPVAESFLRKPGMQVTMPGL